MLRIMTVIENKPSLNRSLQPEFGLSFFIEKDGRRILFDCGSDGLAAHNAEHLNINLKDVDQVVLSHSHFDHAGGYPEFVKKGLVAPLVTGTDFWEEKYALKEGKYAYLGCGFNSEFLENNGIEHKICKDTIELFEGCYAVSDFSRNYEFEIIPARFKRITKQSMVEDNFSDELCLVFDTAKGLVVIVGCSHPGILNILSAVRERFKKKIYAVFGGSHLKDADEDRINATVKVLEDFGIEIMGLNHCTGESAEQCIGAMTKNMQVVSLHTGEGLFLDV